MTNVRRRYSTCLDLQLRIFFLCLLSYWMANARLYCTHSLLSCRVFILQSRPQFSRISSRLRLVINKLSFTLIILILLTISGLSYLCSYRLGIRWVLAHLFETEFIFLVFLQGELGRSVGWESGMQAECFEYEWKGRIVGKQRKNKSCIWAKFTLNLQFIWRMLSIIWLPLY